MNEFLAAGRFKDKLTMEGTFSLPTDSRSTIKGEVIAPLDIILFSLVEPWCKKREVEEARSPCIKDAMLEVVVPDEGVGG